MEKQCVVQEYEDKLAKNGKPYTRFKMEDGKWISCFNQTAIKKIKEKTGRNIVLNVFTSTKEGYENLETIASFKQDLDEAEVIDMVKEKTVAVKEKTVELAKERENRQWAVMAKEIYLAFLSFDTEKTIDDAIVITKKIRDEFK